MAPRKTVLVVDDEPAVRNLIHTLLTDAYNVVLGVDGVDATQRYEQYAGGISAVITDVQMPQLDGARLIEWLRERQPTLPVIVMSGGLGKPDVEHLLHSPGIEWLGKPFMIDDLRLLLERLLNPTNARTSAEV